MTALIVVFMFVGLVLVDVLVRLAQRRLDEARARRERAAALETSLRLDFTHEAKSLKRASVNEPRGRILAVDDEPVVLDSFRKILVLAGFDVDTVETGPEALGLIQRHDYDLLFTDLKMPGMDGVEVLKADRHLRPDVDIAVVTGYGTIESAVATMQHGAVDYVQKPFTEEELLAFASRLLIRRQARLEALRAPSVRIVAPSAAETAGGREYCVPGGAFLSEGHAWARIEPGGQLRAGLDDFARKALGDVDGVELPRPGQSVERGEPLFAVKRGRHRAHFGAPMTGKVVAVNEALESEPELLTQSPYVKGWVCVLQPKDLAGELGTLRIGNLVVPWYQAEIERLRQVHAGADVSAPGEGWAAFEQDFLRPTTAAAAR
jgi:CheY-like chemotaxis protein